MLKYLARYVSGIAISNGRILSDDGETITFYAKDYRKKKRVQLQVSGDEFVRRFLFHILPHRLRRLRYYGLLAPEKCNLKLALCRRLLLTEAGASLIRLEDEADDTEVEGGVSGEPLTPACPRCEMPGMRHLGKLNAQQLRRAQFRLELLEERLVKVVTTAMIDQPYRITLDTDWHVAQGICFVEFVGLPLPEW